MNDDNLRARFQVYGPDGIARLFEYQWTAERYAIEVAETIGEPVNVKRWVGTHYELTGTANPMRLSA